MTIWLCSGTGAVKQRKPENNNGFLLNWNTVTGIGTQLTLLSTRAVFCEEMSLKLTGGA